MLKKFDESFDFAKNLDFDGYEESSQESRLDHHFSYKKEIVFETERNPESWIRLLGSKNYKTKLKAYMLGVEI